MTIKIETTGKELSSMGGLLIAKSLLEKTQLKGVLGPLLPKLMSGSSRSWDKFQSLALGFIAGADCLDDMAVYSQDKGFLEITERADYSPKAYGDFLRSFNNIQIRALRSSLIDFAFNLRSSCEEWKTITFDFDSTSNLQHGLKMEGVEENYTRNLSLRRALPFVTPLFHPFLRMVFPFCSLSPAYTAKVLLSVCRCSTMY